MHQNNSDNYLVRRKNSPELNGWALAAMSEAKRNRLRTVTKLREPPASGARGRCRGRLKDEAAAPLCVKWNEGFCHLFQAKPRSGTELHNPDLVSA